MKYTNTQLAIATIIACNWQQFEHIFKILATVYTYFASLQSCRLDRKIIINLIGVKYSHNMSTLSTSNQWQNILIHFIILYLVCPLNVFNSFSN